MRLLHKLHQTIIRNGWIRPCVCVFFFFWASNTAILFISVATNMKIRLQLKIRFFWQFLVDPFSDAKKKRVILRLQLSNQFNFVKRNIEVLFGKFDINWCVKCWTIKNDDELLLIDSRAHSLGCMRTVKFCHINNGTCFTSFNIKLAYNGNCRPFSLTDQILNDIFVQFLVYCFCFRSKFLIKPNVSQA